MLFRTPHFWQETSFLTALLLPVSYLYYSCVWIKCLLTTPYKAPVPVICIGNITVGGTGKTPVAIALMQLAQAEGIKPCFLSRGYGGSLKGPVKVDLAIHTAKDVGDEPLLLARMAETWICHNRAAGAKAAVASGAELIIMDDGFQNPSLIKDISLLVIDGSKGLGNGYILPAGPLREPPINAFKRSDAVIIVGEDSRNIAGMTRKTVIRAHITPRDITALQAKRYIAFAGIGNPQKFFTTLEESGINVLEKLAFPDHYPYTENDITSLLGKARSLEATLITTEKDAMRLPENIQPLIQTLPVSITWQDEAQLAAIIKSLL